MISHWKYLKFTFRKNFWLWLLKCAFVLFFSQTQSNDVSATRCGFSHTWISPFIKNYYNIQMEFEKNWRLLKIIRGCTLLSSSESTEQAESNLNMRLRLRENDSQSNRAISIWGWECGFSVVSAKLRRQAGQRKADDQIIILTIFNENL